MSDFEAQEQRDDDVDFDFGADTPAVHAEITRRKSLGKPVELQVRDEFGQRTLVVPVNELTWCGNPIPVVLDKEAKTRTRLRDGENPVWYLRLHSHFSGKPADVTFAEFCSRRHPHRVEILRSRTNEAETHEGGDGPAGVPHPLRVAYQRLCSEIGEAIEQYERNCSFGNVPAVCAAIERFVDEFSRFPNWRKELEERVTRVERECASTSPYNRAKQDALRSYRGRPRTPSRAKFAIDGLRQERTRVPIFLAQVLEDRKRIEAVLDRTLGLSEAAIEAFGRWSDICVQIQREAERLEVDGCYYLYHVHQAANSNASERSQAAKAMIATGTLGGAHLGSMREAADSLIAWARANGPGSAEVPDMRHVPVLDRAERAGARTNASPPKAFISYSWDTEDHKKWARELAARLRTSDGVDVKLDQWETVPGDQLPEFMERAIRDNDFVLIICTPNYKVKSDERRGGVGYEGDIMTGEMYTKRDRRKFIPVLRRGEWKTTLPTWLEGTYGVDLRGDPFPAEEYRKLVKALHGDLDKAPPIGPCPDLEAANGVAQEGRGDDAEDSIRGVWIALEGEIDKALIAAGCGQPRNYRQRGTRLKSAGLLSADQEHMLDELRSLYRHWRRKRFRNIDQTRAAEFTRNANRLVEVLRTFV